jgi:hypothetical protein
MDDRSCAFLNLSPAEKSKLCEKFQTLGGLRAAIADGSIHRLDKGWGTEFVREVSNALAAYDKDHPLVSETAAEKERDRQLLAAENEKTRLHATAENDKNRRTQWGVGKLAFVGAVVAALIGGAFLLRSQSEKKNEAAENRKPRNDLKETGLHKTKDELDSEGQQRKSKDGLTNPVYVEPPQTTYAETDFIKDWRKATSDDQLDSLFRKIEKTSFPDWDCTYTGTVSLSSDVEQCVMVIFDSDPNLVGWCFLPKGESAARFKAVNEGDALKVSGAAKQLNKSGLRISHCRITAVASEPSASLKKK